MPTVRALPSWAAALLLAAVLGACAHERPTCCGPAADEPARTIYLVSHGWHAGVVFRRADLPPGAWPEADAFAEAAYLEVGWGDAAYYPHPDAGARELLRAALLPTPSVLHVAAFDLPPERYFPRSDVLRIRVCEAGLGRLLTYVRGAYARDAAGAPRPAADGLYGRSRFYHAERDYHLLHNCNHWIARALRQAGCPTRPATALTVTDLLRQARRFGVPVRLGSHALCATAPGRR